jgi:sterol desaturase/sphingolipid hydroxylase (fatty acid hydroxylase superfamily)
MYRNNELRFGLSMCNFVLRTFRMLMSDPSQPLWLVLVGNLITQAIGYFTVVGLVFLIVWRVLRERLRGARIPAPDRVNGAQIRREVKHTFVTFIVGTTSVGAVIALRGAGLTRIVEGDVPVLVTLAWIAGALAFNDLWFYSWHRFLHRPLPFRLIHAVHHKSVDVNPFTSYSFHAAEGFILGFWIVPAAVLLPIPMTALAVLQVVGLLNNVMSHLGYELLPRWLVRMPILRWTNTATFHSLHHTRLQGNFGLHSRIWDRLFGTEVAEYEAVFVRRGAGAPAPTPSPQ